MTGITHLTEEGLKAFIQWSAPRRADLSLEHLLSCPTCQGRLEAIADPGFFRAFLKPLIDIGQGLTPRDRQRIRGQAVQDALEARACIRQYLTSRNPLRLLGAPVSAFALATVALSLAEELRQRDVPTLQNLCELFLDRIEPDDLLATDVLARLKAEVANCWRLRGDLRKARPLMEDALDLCADVPNPLSRGIVASQAALYYLDAQDFVEARAKCEEALSNFAAIEEEQHLGRVNYILARADVYSGEFDSAMLRLKRLRSETLDDITHLGVTHLLARVLVLKGSHFEVSGLLRDLRSLLGKWSDSPAILANTAWLQALYVGVAGAPAGAAKALAKVAATFVDQGLPLEAALARVDQAYFELEAGLSSQAAQSAAQSLATLGRHQAVYPEAFAALQVLAKAVQSAGLERAEFLELRRALELARSQRAGTKGEPLA